MIIIKVPLDVNIRMPGGPGGIQSQDSPNTYYPVERFSRTNGLKRYFNHSYFRKLLLILIFLTPAFSVFAPENYTVIILKPGIINPFNELLFATGMVESMGNTLAFNEKEGAAGVLQIRQVRLDDYNRRTGKNYELSDMFSYSKSVEVFMYFASIIGPYQIERIAKSWNGSGPLTEKYWERIKAYLD